MPRRNDVAGLSSRLLASGKVTWHWKPSPKLRRMGFVNVALGGDSEEARNKAQSLNAEVAARLVEEEVVPARVATLRRAVRLCERQVAALRRRIGTIQSEQRALRAEIAELVDRKVEQIYFIGGATGDIKIGRSIDPRARIANLQTAHSRGLRILAAAPAALVSESEYHARFTEARKSGEWFSRTPEITAEIRRLREAYPTWCDPLPVRRRAGRDRSV